MKTGTVIAATLALTSLPLMLMAQMPGSQPNSPAMQPGQQTTQPGQQTPPVAPEQPATPAATPEAPAASEAAAVPATTPSAVAEMSPVKGELVSKLDTKTAKTGDNVVVQTKSAVKTADGTEIPTGSKLVGHVLAVQASAGGQNSQVVLKFDHAELTGGQSLPIHSEIRSIGSTEDAAVTSGPEGPATTGGANGSAGTAARSATTGDAPPAAGGAAAAAGTVVARNGKIAISTTSIPGVLLANNAPGEQDPRMAQASSIVLGNKKDIQLEGGTPVVLGVSADGGGSAR